MPLPASKAQCQGLSSHQALHAKSVHAAKSQVARVPEIRKGLKQLLKENERATAHFGGPPVWRKAETWGRDKLNWGLLNKKLPSQLHGLLPSFFRPVFHCNFCHFLVYNTFGLQSPACRVTEKRFKLSSCGVEPGVGCTAGLEQV